MTARVAAFLTVVLVTFCLVTQSPATAAKSWPKLVLSRDGRAWSTDIERPLFGSRVRWVPGDDQVRTFYARNQSGEDARLRVSLSMDDPSSWLGDGRLRMGVLVNGEWRRIQFNGTAGVAHMLIRRGEVVPVRVRVRFAPESGAQTMDRTLRFSMNVRLTQMASWKGETA